jgi:hypothetical protein
MKIYRSASSAAILVVISAGLSAAAEKVKVDTQGLTPGEAYVRLLAAADYTCERQAIPGVHDRADIAACVAATVADAVARINHAGLTEEHHRAQTVLMLAGG